MGRNAMSKRSLHRMNKLIARIFWVSVCSLTLVSAVMAATGKPENVLGPDSTRPCGFFTLQGVPILDPQSGPWAAIPKSHLGYKEIMATLLVASAAQRNVEVRLTGRQIPECSNLGEVDYVILK